MITSGMIAVVILLPIVIGVCEEIGYPRSKLIYPFTVMASAGSGAWFLGTGALNMSWSSVMLKLGAKQGLNINDFLLARLPFALVMLLFMVFFAPKLLKQKETSALKEKKTTQKKPEKLTGIKNTLAIALIVLTIIGMVLSTYLH